MITVRMGSSCNLSAQCEIIPTELSLPSRSDASGHKVKLRDSLVVDFLKRRGRSHHLSVLWKRVKCFAAPLPSEDFFFCINVVRGSLSACALEYAYQMQQLGAAINCWAKLMRVTLVEIKTLCVWKENLLPSWLQWMSLSNEAAIWSNCEN